MTQVVVIGAGVVGAAIAYELSQVRGLNVTLLDKNTSASGATGAALGILMGAISHKTKGRAWRLRQTSMQRYEKLVSELEALTGTCIPFNQQGILKPCFAEQDLEQWEKLVEIRRAQGWQLEIWEEAQVKAQCPQLHHEKIIRAIYSPQDRQINPTALTQALVAGAKLNGVNCQFGMSALDVTATYHCNASETKTSRKLHTSAGVLDTDWLVVAAGLGSMPLTASMAQPLDVRPVLGQALHLRLPRSLEYRNFQPVVTGDDVHIIPLGEGDYWVGATVEFPDEAGEVAAEPALLEKVKQEAITLCPALAEATILNTWSGKRPRPEGRAAPIIEALPGYDNVLLATGHYRNGILLAPATAQAIREAIVRTIKN